MRTHRSLSRLLLPWLAGSVALFLPRSQAAAQVALFSSPTDSISILGTVTLNNAATYEAVLMPAALSANAVDINHIGTVFNEWLSGYDDKHLLCSLLYQSAFTAPLGKQYDNLTSAIMIDPVFHHLAYVYDGTEERLYLDGALVASRPMSGSIQNNAGAASVIGAISRDGGIDPAFTGYIDQVRISDVARYSGFTFTPPAGDLPTDSHTMLLYKFDQAAGATTVDDLSGNGHVGTPGTSFSTATAPTFGAVPPFTLAVSQHAIASGGVVSGTVTLPSAAPSGGAMIALQGQTGISVPAQVTVPAGSTSATFTVTAAKVTKDTPVLLQAQYKSVVLPDPLLVTPAKIAAVAVSPVEVPGGSSATFTVKLSVAAGSEGAVVNLSSQSPSVKVPPIIVIPAGDLRASVKITTMPVSADQQVHITASYANTSKQAVLTVITPVPKVVALSKSTVVGGITEIGKVTLGSPAPSGGIAVTLSSSDAVATVPSSVKVVGGQTSATFLIATSSVSTNHKSTMTASLNGRKATTVLTVEPNYVLSIGLSPNPTQSASVVLGTLVLAAPAGPGGVTVAITSDSTAAVAAPGSVMIPAGESKVYFTVYTGTVTAKTTAHITATVNGIATTRTLTINP